MQTSIGTSVSATLRKWGVCALVFGGKGEGRQSTFSESVDS